MGQVISQDKLILQRRNWKRNGESVVFVSGCFDLLHPGYIRLLEQARSYGDILVVGVQADQRIQAERRSALSGAGRANLLRPVTPGAERAEILAALAAVDYAVEFDADFADAWMARLSPEIVVKGAVSTSSATEIPEDRAATAIGARIVRILLEPGYSTAHLIERIVEPRV